MRWRTGCHKVAVSGSGRTRTCKARRLYLFSKQAPDPAGSLPSSIVHRPSVVPPARLELAAPHLKDGYSSRLSYGGMCLGRSARVESNHRPAAYKTDALTTELRAASWTVNLIQATKRGAFCCLNITYKPATKSDISCGTAVSKPTTSSMPASSGSAMLKPLLVIPTTIILAGMPILSR